MGVLFSAKAGRPENPDGRFEIVLQQRLFLLQPVVVMQPVGFKEVDEENDAAHAPGKRIGREDDVDFGHKRHDDGDIGHAQHTPDGKHDEHRHRRLARAAHNARDAVGKGQEAEEQRLHMGLPHADLNDGGVVLENGHERLCQQEQHHADALGQRCGADDAEAHALLHALILMCTEVLADEGRQRHREAGDGKEGKALELGIGAAARHGVRAEGVDVALHDDVCEGDDGILYAGGQAKVDNLLEHRQMEANLAQAHTVDRVIVAQAEDAQAEAHELRNTRGQCGRPDPPMEHTDKQQIERDVHKRRQDQVIQRVAAVSHGLQDANAEVIHDDGYGARKIHPEIVDGVRQHVRIRLHEAQQLRRERHAEHRQHDARRQAEGQRRMDGRLEFLVVLRAVVACDDDARADGDAVEKADEQEDQTAGGADGGIGVLIQEAADDKGVSCVVELLENVSEQDRQGKKQHAAPDRAGGQRMLHLRLLFFSEILFRHRRSVPQSCLRTGNRGKERRNGNHQGVLSRSFTRRSGKKCKIIILFYTFANGLAKKSERAFGISRRPAA